MRPVPSLGLDKDLVAFLGEVRAAVQRLQQPEQPQQAFATTSAELPDAAAWKACVVLVTDKTTLAISTLVGATWTWLRADGSAI